LASKKKNQVLRKPRRELKNTKKTRAGGLYGAALNEVLEGPSDLLFFRGKKFYGGKLCCSSAVRGFVTALSYPIKN
jgi:hypothetical protein